MSGLDPCWFAFRTSRSCAVEFRRNSGCESFVFKSFACASAAFLRFGMSVNQDFILVSCALNGCWYNFFRRELGSGTPRKLGFCCNCRIMVPLCRETARGRGDASLCISLGSSLGGGGGLLRVELVDLVRSFSCRSGCCGISGGGVRASSMRPRSGVCGGNAKRCQ